MFERSAIRRLIVLAALLAAGPLFGWTGTKSHAGDAPSARTKQGAGAPARTPRDAVIGGYSMTLSDIWGLPEMPPAPTDFGPHFDYPPASLNGPPLHDPYPN